MLSFVSWKLGGQDHALRKHFIPVQISPLLSDTNLLNCSLSSNTALAEPLSLWCPFSLQMFCVFSIPLQTYIRVMLITTQQSHYRAVLKTPPKLLVKSLRQILRTWAESSHICYQNITGMVGLQPSYQYCSFLKSAEQGSCTLQCSWCYLPGSYRFSCFSSTATETFYNPLKTSMVRPVTEIALSFLLNFALLTFLSL